MKNQIKNKIFTYHTPYTLLFKYTYPLIASAIVAMTLSPADIRTAYDPYGPASARAFEDAQTAATEKLWEAVDTNDARLALEAIREHADINAVDRWGNTPLAIAAQDDNINMVQLLIEHNATPTPERRGPTPLITAASEGRTEIVNLLLTQNTNINEQDEHKWTALIRATFEGHTDIVHLLVENNANMNLQDADGNTALMCAAREYSSTIWDASANHDKILKILILYGANTTILNNDNLTALNITTPARRRLIKSVTQERDILEKELGQQNWDLEISSPIAIIRTFILPELAPLVCAYADPYNTTEQPLRRAIQHYIQNNIKQTQVPESARALESVPVPKSAREPAPVSTPPILTATAPSASAIC